jgi:hypothetical protein
MLPAPVEGSTLPGCHHTPWSPWYARKKINEGQEERWFCDEAEALEAGWRGARSR